MNHACFPHPTSPSDLSTRQLCLALPNPAAVQISRASRNLEFETVSVNRGHLTETCLEAAQQDEVPSASFLIVFAFYISLFCFFCHD